MILMQLCIHACSIHVYTETHSRQEFGPVHFGCETNEPRREKTGLRGFRPGPTQTGLYKLRKELEA